MAIRGIRKYSIVRLSPNCYTLSAGRDWQGTDVLHSTRTNGWVAVSGTELLAGVSPTVQAIAVIAIVLVEAVILYGGYGLVEDAVAPTVFRRLRRTQ